MFHSEHAFCQKAQVVSQTHAVVQDVTLALPSFFIVGAPKTGTTSLHHYLDQHPQIYMSPVKEPCYFASEVRLEQFGRAAPRHGEVTIVASASCRTAALDGFLWLPIDGGPDDVAADAVPLSLLRGRSDEPTIRGLRGEA